MSMQNGDLKILIVDDEAPARARLVTMLDDLGGWQVVGEAANGEQAVQLSQAETPDVVLLDVRMPGMDGMEAARHLADLDHSPAVIFTTAFDEYAVQAFETHAVGYLLKPVRRERLLRALEQAVRITRLKLAELAEAQVNAARTRIPVRRAGRLELVPVDAIKAFRADQKYVQMLYEQDGEVHESLLDETLKDLEQEFATEFMRIHRNTLVRVTCIDSMTPAGGATHQVNLQGVSEALPVSRRHYSELKERLQRG